MTYSVHPTTLSPTLVATLRFTSQLSASPEVVWAHVTSPAGINQELAPFMRMTFPRDLAALDENSVRVGEPICSSWFLLFGLLPIDRAHVTLKEIGPGRRFVEQSPLSSMRLWRHTREVTDSEQGSVVQDTLDFEPRLPILRAMAEWTIRSIFMHRHARLRRMFG